MKIRKGDKDQDKHWLITNITIITEASLRTVICKYNCLLTLCKWRDTVLKTKILRVQHLKFTH